MCFYGIMTTAGCLAEVADEGGLKRGRHTAPQEVRMTRFMASAIVLAVVPMTMLNAMGRPGFLGYYLGVITMWLLFVIVGKRAAPSAETQ